MGLPRPPTREQCGSCASADDTGMVICGSFDRCAVTGRFRPRRRKSNERAWSCRGKLVLALHRGNVVENRLPVAARIDGKVQAFGGRGIKRSDRQGAKPHICVSTLFIVNANRLLESENVKSRTPEAVEDNDRTSSTAPAVKLSAKRPTWAQTEGTPLPLGVTWIGDEQAFNFAVYTEHAESVTLLLYSADDFAKPILTFPFDFVRNKSGRIWHCRLPLNQMRGARYYAYSVFGQVVSQLNAFDPDKVLLDPYANCVFFPPEFDRKLACGPAPTQEKHRWEC